MKVRRVTCEWKSRNVKVGEGEKNKQGLCSSGWGSIEREGRARASTVTLPRCERSGETEMERRGV